MTTSGESTTKMIACMVPIAATISNRCHSEGRFVRPEESAVRSCGTVGAKAMISGNVTIAYRFVIPPVLSLPAGAGAREGSEARDLLLTASEKLGQLS